MSHRRSWIVAIFLMASVIGLARARAADLPWAAWLYDSAAGRMIQVDSGGAVLNDFALRADPGSTFSRKVAVSADGMFVAYAAVGFDGLYVNIFNLTSNAVMYSYRLPGNAVTSLEFSGSAFNFSDGNGSFAFGYTAEGQPWQIILVEMETFQAASLKEGDAPVSSFEAANGFVLPVVTYNRSGTVAFMMIPLGTDGSARYDAYTWDTTANTVTANETYITPDTDTFGLTNEVVMTLSDERFPESADPLSSYPSNNTLQAASPARAKRVVVASQPRIYSPTFIQGGERVAVIHYDNLDDGQRLSVQVIERGGTLAGTLEGEDVNTVSSMAGVLDGMVFTASQPDATAGTRLYSVKTRGETAPYTAVPVWTSDEASAVLVWVSDLRTASAEPFAEWADVSPTGA